MTREDAVDLILDVLRKHYAYDGEGAIALNSEIMVAQAAYRRAFDDVAQELDAQADQCEAAGDAAGAELARGWALGYRERVAEMGRKEHR